jgi:hypothetical protein
MRFCFLEGHELCEAELAFPEIYIVLKRLRKVTYLPVKTLPSLLTHVLMRFGFRGGRELRKAILAFP